MCQKLEGPGRSMTGNLSVLTITWLFLRNTDFQQSDLMSSEKALEICLVNHSSAGTSALLIEKKKENEDRKWSPNEIVLACQCCPVLLGDLSVSSLLPASRRGSLATLCCVACW